MPNAAHGRISILFFMLKIFISLTHVIHNNYSIFTLNHNIYDTPLSSVSFSVLQNYQGTYTVTPPDMFIPRTIIFVICNYTSAIIFSRAYFIFTLQASVMLEWILHKTGIIPDKCGSVQRPISFFAVLFNL